MYKILSEPEGVAASYYLESLSYQVLGCIAGNKERNHQTPYEVDR